TRPRVLVHLATHGRSGVAPSSQAPRDAAGECELHGLRGHGLRRPLQDEGCLRLRCLLRQERLPVPGGSREARGGLKYKASVDLGAARQAERKRIWPTEVEDVGT